jgi:hypothetical protein
MMVFKIIIITLLTMGFLMHSAHADRMYTWTDDQGVIHITKQPPPPKAKADNVIHYKPQTEEQIRATQQEAEKQQKRDDEIRKRDYKKKPPNTSAASVEPPEPDVYYQYDGGRYTERSRRYERRKAIKEHLENNKPIKRPRQPRAVHRRR